MEMAATCLVIDARKLDSLSIDGPALKVRMHMQSSRLFPLRRLSRIHVIGTLRYGLESLLHCAEHQVPVAFFTYTGKLRCQMYFSVVENSIISHWLEHVDFDVEAQQIYEDWLEHQTLHLMSQLGYLQGARETRFKRLSEKLRNICNNKMGHRDFVDAMNWLIGIFTVHLSQLIVDHGLSNQSAGKRRLMKDVSPVCEILLIYFLAMAASKRKIKVSALSMSDLYQQHADEIEYTARKMLSQLASRLESIV